MNSKIITVIDQQRIQQGYLSLDALLSLSGKGNVVLDPFSTLISDRCVIGSGNIFYPSLIIECDDEGGVEIGDDNTFFPNCMLVAKQGLLVIGSKNQFGEGGCTIKANSPGALIRFEDDGRYINGPIILGKSQLGSGSQVLGPITVQDCILGGGKAFTAKDPDNQGAVLKGYGLARGLELATGDVINGQGSFSEQSIERQSAYHAKVT